MPLTTAVSRFCANPASTPSSRSYASPPIPTRDGPPSLSAGIFGCAWWAIPRVLTASVASSGVAPIRSPSGISFSFRPTTPSRISRTRFRLPLAIHQEVFTWVPAKDGLVLGGRIGVDASTMEANAALRTIVRRDAGENYRQMLSRMATESGIESPRANDLVRLDRTRKGKTLSNKDWRSPVDPDAKVANPKRRGLNSWRGDHEARRVVYNNRVGISSGVGKSLGRPRAELVERSLEHTLDRSRGIRRGWLADIWPK